MQTECNRHNKTEPCRLEIKYTDPTNGRVGSICKTHQLWVYDFPVKVESKFIYDDGSNHLVVKEFNSGSPASTQ